MSRQEARITKLEAAAASRPPWAESAEARHRRWCEAAAAIVVTLPERLIDPVTDELAGEQPLSALGLRICTLAAAAAESEEAPTPRRGPLVVPASVAELLAGKPPHAVRFGGLRCVDCGLEAPHDPERLRRALPGPVDPVAAACFPTCQACDGPLAWAEQWRGTR
jgi:hypothetical protein